MKMGLIFDTSAVLNFGHRCGKNRVGEHVLKLLKKDGEIIIPQIVYDEAYGDPPRQSEAGVSFDYEKYLNKYFSIRLTHVSVPDEALFLEKTSRLQQGEIEVLRLGFEYPFTLVLDDRAARTVAKMVGLPYTGTIGVLNDAHLKGWIDANVALDTVREIKRQGFLLPKLGKAVTWEEYYDQIHNQQS